MRANRELTKMYKLLVGATLVTGLFLTWTGSTEAIQLYGISAQLVSVFAAIAERR